MSTELFTAIGEMLLPWQFHATSLNTGEDDELKRRRLQSPTLDPSSNKESTMALALIPAAVTAVAKALPKASPAIMARIAPRLSLANVKTTADTVTRIVKNNKISLALVAYELWGPANQILIDLMNGDPEIKGVIEAVRKEEVPPTAPPPAALPPPVVIPPPVIADLPITPVPPALKYELEEQRDENEMISFAISRLGSLENVETLWRVFHLTPAHFASYRSIRAAGKGLR